jgi:serine protease Do
MRQRTATYFVAIILIICASALVMAMASDWRLGSSRVTAQTQEAASALASSTDPGGPMNTALFRNIATQQNPIVVFITTESRVRVPDLSDFFGPDNFFHRFFGGPSEPRERVQRGLGSGFLITADGEILTNNHVVAGAEEIRVGLFEDERKTYPAKILGRDPLTDSALIKLENGPGGLPTATLGDSDALRPGDWVLAIGNPFRLGHTVTVGVVSYNGRPFSVTEGRFQNMLQTDASINPGNSGGPLINTDSEVVGISTAIFSESGGNIGIGFAVPINAVRTLLPQLREGEVHRGRLGVRIQSWPITEEEAAALDLPQPQGAIVSMVERDSPADRAGLRAGDVIVEYNGKPVSDGNQLTTMVVSTRAGENVPIVYYREGERQTATVEIEALELADGDDDQAADGRSAPGFGLSLGDITPNAARELRLPVDIDGALVEDVAPFTPGAEAGIRRGDVILEVNRNPVRSASQASQALRQLESGEIAFVLLWRQGDRLFLQMRKE